MAVGLSVLTLATAGTLSSASAATTTWKYQSYYNGECLASNAGYALTETCQPYTNQRWHWGSESNTWQGHTMRRLVNEYTGECLTTDNKSELNAVWMSPCGGGRSGQFWTADNKHIQNQNGTFLTANGDGSLTTVREGSDANAFLWYGWT
ncbi:hypothetical protein ACIBBD_27690 [Streptomyces sp. NPDC051315]|uniref:hypothetical protein n=1 Tax=Streptomyces sp. NPDC051315 TaxID=3365650 RepID=UPI00378D0475